jgi:hypothetical protein
MFKTTLLSLGASFVGARAQNGVDTAAGSFAPWDIETEDWPQLMTKPDLQGIWPIRGFNVSRDDFHEPNLDWALTLSVKKAIPANGTLGDNLGNSTFAGAMYRIEPPEALIQAALGSLEQNGNEEDDDNDFEISAEPWSVCQTRYTFTLSDNRTTLEGDNGSCSNIFSESCRRAIEDDFNVTYAYDEEYRNLGACRIRNMPRECNFRGGGSHIHTFHSLSRWEDEIGEEKAKDIDWLRGTELMSAATTSRFRDPEEVNVERVTGGVDFFVIRFAFEEEKASGDGVNVRVASRLVCPQGLNATSEEGQEDGDDDGEGDEDSADDGEDDDDGSSAMSPAMVSVLAGVGLCLMALL